MLTGYAPILVLLALAIGFALVNLFVSELMGRRRINVGKADPYECGMEAQGSARIRLSIHFYLIAVLFILFDVESVFLILWAVSAGDLKAAGLAPLVLALAVAIDQFRLGAVDIGVFRKQRKA